MSTRMLIDARHREETRVAVVKGNRIEEFDFESEEHKQLKGNIYLAKVTRVEPSLQAAFIDYGGNRHGFLAFSEIHPDYYQIPKEDREALLREEAEHAAAEDALRGQDGDEDEEADGDDVGGAHEPRDLDEGDQADGDEAEDDEAPAPQPTATGGGDDASVESLRQRRMSLRRRYKIQDVIRRRQVLLVQVVKEERGNKGAALTTYLSLAGRYCVLMPNTSHGGGISRKISNAGDRKRLKSILAELNLPSTMGCIVRTAGLQRGRDEIRRDFDYLARLWDEIRERTLSSAAPAEIYRDSDLVKRAIRDIYNKDIDEVIVEGEEGYRAARQFMKLLMPAAARKIAPYSDAVPLFQRHGVEDQLAAMYQPVVQLKSGGYIVINPTEALVSIDINSGRSTREHNIEQTATATNLEAAQEIARQLRLRDMAGLIVIDFIDMEQGSNNRKVEKAMKEALKNDRARIQVGRISGFGLFEMSRQRLRTGVLEASTRMCPHCDGTGFIRTASSAGLQALRLLEEEAARGRGSRLCMRASQEATLYVLNRKRAELADIEDRYGVVIEVLSDGSADGARMSVEASGLPPAHAPRLPQPIVAEPDDDLPEETEEDVAEAAAEPLGADEEGEGDGRRRRRRRRRRGGRRDEAADGAPSSDEADAGEAEDEEEPETAEAASVFPADGEPAADAPEPGERRRRGRRGRRGSRDRMEATADTAIGTPATDPAEAQPEPELALDAEAASEREAADPLVAEASETATGDPVAAGEATPADPVAAESEAEAEQPRPAARRRPRARRPATAASEAVAPADVTEPTAETDPPAPDAGATEPPAKPRRGRGRAASADAAPAGDAETRPTRTRRRGTGTRTDAAPADAAPAEPTLAESGPAGAEADAAPPEPAPLAGAAEPTLPIADAAAAEPDAPLSAEPAGATEPRAGGGENATPPRRGWWQRTFGG